MNNDILTYKNKQSEKYREIQNEIRRKIREAMEKYLDNQCKEIEELEKKHNSQATGIYTYKRNGLLVNEDKQVITCTKESLNEWTRYARDLFNDKRRPELSIISSNDFYITRQELGKALSNTKDGKAKRSAGIHIEVI